MTDFLVGPRRPLTIQECLPVERRKMKDVLEVLDRPMNSGYLLGLLASHHFTLDHLEGIDRTGVKLSGRNPIHPEQTHATLRDFFITGSKGGYDVTFSQRKWLGSPVISTESDEVFVGIKRSARSKGAFNEVVPNLPHYYHSRQVEFLLEQWEVLCEEWESLYQARKAQKTAQGAVPPETDTSPKRHEGSTPVVIL